VVKIHTEPSPTPSMMKPPTETPGPCGGPTSSIDPAGRDLTAQLAKSAPAISSDNELALSCTAGPLSTSLPAPGTFYPLGPALRPRAFTCPTEVDAQNLAARWIDAHRTASARADDRRPRRGSLQFAPRCWMSVGRSCETTPGASRNITAVRSQRLPRRWPHPQSRGIDWGVTRALFGSPLRGTRARLSVPQRLSA
jgi:hypothetical protein